MKAVVLEGGETAFRPDYPMTVRKPGEALIRVLIAGICFTDLELIRGHAGFSGVPGHEFVGVVEEADTQGLVGKRVVGEINCPCHECALCQMGLERHCRQRTVMGLRERGGSFAEYVSLPEANLHVVPDCLDDETAVFVEPTAAVFRIMEQVPPRKSERWLVMGDGRLGLLVAQVLAPLCDATLLGAHATKIAIARRMGIKTGVSGAFDEKDFDVVVEATGKEGGLATALDFLKPRGTLVLKSIRGGDTPVPIWRVVVNEITVVGSRGGLFEPTIKALADGTVKVKELISGRYGLDEFGEAIAKCADRQTAKVLLYPQGAP